MMNDLLWQTVRYTEQLYIELCFRFFMDDANHSDSTGDILWLESLECIDVQENSDSEKGGNLCQ